MHDDVGVIHEFGQELTILNAIEVVLQAIRRLGLAYVFNAAGGQVIEKDDVVSAIQQSLCEVRPNETCTTGDQETQMAS